MMYYTYYMYDTMAEPKRRISISLDKDLVENIDGMKGREPRSPFINRTLRKALGMSEP